jgi:beta-galactosidase GanA
MGAAGRKRVTENFDIRENVKKTQELYLNILEKYNQKIDVK